MGQKASLARRLESYAFIARIPMSPDCRTRIMSRAPVLLEELRRYPMPYISAKKRRRYDVERAYDEAEGFEKWDTFEEIVFSMATYEGRERDLPSIKTAIQHACRHLEHAIATCTPVGRKVVFTQPALT